MFSKHKHNWAIFAFFSPYRFNYDDTRHIRTKKNSKINFIVVKSFLEPNCKGFIKSARTKLQAETWPTDEKNSFQLTIQLHYFHQHTE